MKTKQATLCAWGASTAVRLPRAVVKQAGLHIGQVVQFESADDGSITIKPVVATPKLEDLLAAVTPENMPDAADVSWSKPAGTEAW